MQLRIGNSHITWFCQKAQTPKNLQHLRQVIWPRGQR